MLIGVSELLAKTWELYRTHWRTLATYMLCLFLPTFVLFVAGLAGQRYGHGGAPGRDGRLWSKIQGPAFMRIVHWLFVVGVALFVSGIGFVIAGARSSRAAAPVEAAVTTTPVASVKQIMKGIVAPAATVVFNSVSTTVSFKGTEEHAPHTEEEWETVANSAAALVESGNLLLMGSRAVDKGDWVKMSQALIDAGKVALKATKEKSPEGVLGAGEAVNTSCDNCHRKYQRG